MTRADAERLAREWLASEPTAAAHRLVINGEATTEHEIGWAVAPTFPDGSRGYGLGVVIVTRRGEVFTTGSASPVEVYLEEVAVMTGATLNPVRLLRHGWRRLVDGRTPIRVHRAPVRPS